MNFGPGRVGALLIAWSCAFAAHAAAPSIGPLAAAKAARAGGPEVRVEARVQRAEATVGLAKAGKLRAVHRRAFSIPAPSPDEVDRAIGAPMRGAPLKIGFDRDVPGLDTESGVASALEWETRADGARAAALSIASPTAEAVRAGLRVRRLPDAARVRFQAPGATELFEFTGAQVNEAIARNVAAGESGRGARTFWSPLVEGSAIDVEVELPPGTAPAEVAISIPKISHLVTSPAKGFAMTTKSASACEIDAMCSSGWTNAMNSVARMIFSDSSGTYACSGTLLADQDTASNVPYFLSANHCISTQTAASSLTTYWFYHSTSCNSGVLNSQYKQLTGGATLLYASTSTDTSFMRLNATPPAGTVYSGWYVAATPPAGSAVTGLHHPQADLLKISGGSVNGYLTCSAPSSGSFSCSGASASSSTFYEVGWTSGITEGGSSGSGLFLNSGQYLIGQLYGGSGDCVTAGYDAYGRFDAAYNTALKRWLSSQTLTVGKAGTGGGTVASSPSGINCGSACTASFPTGTSVALSATPATGSVFTGWSGACSGTGGCSLALNSATSVTASFAPASVALSVAVTGSGTVASSPAGINCGATCTASFTYGTPVSLAATPAPGYLFASWSGSCSGNTSCAVTLNGSTLVGATFLAKSASATTIASSLNPSLVGQSLTFIARVSGSSGTPTGSVAFSVDGSPATGCAAVPLASGAASCPVSGLSVGTHSLAAAYSGDGQYNASASALTQAVSPPGTLQVSVSPPSVDFGGQSMGTTSPVQAVTVTNSGAATVTFSAASIADPQFALADGCASIAPGASCTIGLTFTPAPASGAIDSTVSVSGALTITSDAANSPTSVPLAGTAEKSLVSHYYRSILRRDPDASGKAFWEYEAAHLLSLGADVNETWYAMALQFFASGEYAALGRDDAGFVTDLYVTFFNRPPDSAGLAFWTRQLASGMPRDMVLVSFLFSPEFESFTQAIFGATPARAEVDAVMDFYRGLLGRLPDDSGYAYWVQQFRTAQCQGAAAVQAQADAISRAFAGSAEYLQRNRSNAQYVGDLYDTFLRRGGDLPGAQYWIGQLDGGSQTREQLRQAFLASPEFSAKVSAIVAQGCLP